jgi:hypothetical protein
MYLIGWIRLFQNECPSPNNRNRQLNERVVWIPQVQCFQPSHFAHTCVVQRPAQREWPNPLRGASQWRDMPFGKSVSSQGCPFCGMCWRVYEFC